MGFLKEKLTGEFLVSKATGFLTSQSATLTALLKRRATVSSIFNL